MQQNIIIYGRIGSCAYCDEAKDYFNQLGLTYEFRDISTVDVVDRIRYKKELMADKVDKIPYIKIGENKFIGFDENIKKCIDMLLEKC